jgi:Uma2 family endonuclease
MNIPVRVPTVRAEAAQRFVLHGVGWDDYEKFVDALNEQHVRTTYDRGSLELMSPLPIHEQYKRAFGLLFAVLGEELDIRVMGAGSTTFRSRKAGRGLEPDECFYLASAEKVQDWGALDLSIDPPPDLAVEVEITHGVLDRLRVYAALRVPEVWRFDGAALKAWLLAKGGRYRPVAGSRALPFLPLEEIVPFMHSFVSLGDERKWMRQVRDWVRTRVLPAKEAAERRRRRRPDA